MNKYKNNYIVLMRGAPGSGKSTYLRNNYPDAVICSADVYFVNSKGNYNFDPRKLGDAHNYCKFHFRKALEKGEPVVAVDNTNRTVRELAPYVEMAKYFGYTVCVIYLIVDPVIAAKRCVHGVPHEKVISMANGIEVIPDEWKEDGSLVEKTVIQ